MRAPTPTTSNRTPSIDTILSTGSRLPNSLSAVSQPRMATYRPALNSGVAIGRPIAMFVVGRLTYSFVTPWIETLSSDCSRYLTCARMSACAITSDTCGL